MIARPPFAWQAGISGLAALSCATGLTLALLNGGRPVDPPATARPAASPKAVIPPQYRALVAMTTIADSSAPEGRDARKENDALPFSHNRVAAIAPFMALGPTGSNHDRALQCLTQAVYYEAGYEPEAGRRAVAQVVLNRVRHPAFAKSVCGVVYQGFQAPGCQFSFTCDGSLARRPAPQAWAEARRIAAEALAGAVYAPVGTATHYHADYVFPRWAPYLSKLAKIGAHIFYRWPGSWGLPNAFLARYVGGEYVPAVDLSRFAALPSSQIAYPAVAALPERRADNDLGGRLDPTKGWTLAIPDPAQTHGSLSGILARQGDAPSPSTPAATPTTRLASADESHQEKHP
ncbi:cell wall hydrolase [Sphingobium aquiterrae]|uniref:cell wall hydrolase n=1 Tax=Sphingobium aquiterrae TaxID=2038656 RepID=UPI0030188CC8